MKEVRFAFKVELISTLNVVADLSVHQMFAYFADKFPLQVLEVFMNCICNRVLILAVSAEQLYGNVPVYLITCTDKTFINLDGDFVTIII